MNTIKITTMVITFCSGSFLMLDHPAHRKWMPAKKQAINTIVTEDQPKVTPIILNDFSDKFIADHQQDLMNREVNVISIKKYDARGIIFRIQVLSANKPVSPDSRLFSVCPEVRTYFSKGRYTYTVGKFKSPGESNQMFFDLNAKGFEDAFMVAFKDDKPIPVNEAMNDIIRRK